MPISWEKRSEEHTSELQSHSALVCRLLLEKKKNTSNQVLTMPTITRWRKIQSAARRMECKRVVDLEDAAAFRLGELDATDVFCFVRRRPAVHTLSPYATVFR